MALTPNRNPIFVSSGQIPGKNDLSWKQFKGKENMLNTNLNSQEGLVLERKDKNVSGSKENSNLDCTESC